MTLIRVLPVVFPSVGVLAPCSAYNRKMSRSERFSMLDREERRLTISRLLVLFRFSLRLLLSTEESGPPHLWMSVPYDRGSVMQLVAVSFLSKARQTSGSKTNDEQLDNTSCSSIAAQAPHVGAGVSDFGSFSRGRHLN